MSDEERTQANEGYFSTAEMARLWNKFRRQRDKNAKLAQVWVPYYIA